MNKKITLVCGAFLAGLGVALGAMGSHVWESILDQKGRVGTFETAVKYQLYHAFALLVVGLLTGSEKENKLRVASWAFFMGTVLFSGSLYVLSFTNAKWVVYATPMGGLLMLTGWTALLLHFLKMRE